MKYKPPYSVAEVRRVYGAELLNYLFKAPCHRWRMETGIELIHKEPTVKVPLFTNFQHGTSE